MSEAMRLLIEAGDLPEDSVQGVLEYASSANVGLPRALHDHANIPGARVRWAYAKAEGFESIPDLAALRSDPVAVSRLTKAQAQSWEVIPVGFDGTTLVVAATLATAKSQQVNDNMRLALDNSAFRWQISTSAEVKAKINTEYRNENQIGELTQAARSGGTQAIDAAQQTVDLILEQAVRDRASDIHLDPSENDVFVRYRIDGVTIDRQPLPREMREAIVSVIKIRAEIDIADSRKPMDGRLTTVIGDTKIDLRVATLPTVWGEKVVMRILDNSSALRPLDDFAFSEQNIKRWRHGYDRPDGLVMVTGPTGSGKSTTLYATLNEIARPDVNVITVEDPVEYRIHRINQVQVNAKAGLTFASALRSILRSDPDVILVGEIRDLETATIAIEASLTGHLVLTTLHTNSAPQTAVRLVEMGVEPYLVSTTLECVLAQRLVRRLCPACKVRYDPTPQELAAVRFSAPDVPEHQFFAPVGCNKCSGIGYAGRLALHETMLRTERLENALSSGASVQEVTRIAMDDGMVPLRHDGWAKVAQGITTIAEVLRVVSGEGSLT